MRFHQDLLSALCPRRPKKIQDRRSCRNHPLKPRHVRVPDFFRHAAPRATHHQLSPSSVLGIGQVGLVGLVGDAGSEQLVVHSLGEQPHPLILVLNKNSSWIETHNIIGTAVGRCYSPSRLPSRLESIEMCLKPRTWSHHFCGNYHMGLLALPGGHFCSVFEALLVTEGGRERVPSTKSHETGPCNFGSKDGISNKLKSVSNTASEETRTQSAERCISCFADPFNVRMLCENVAVREGACIRSG